MYTYLLYCKIYIDSVRPNLNDLILTTIKCMKQNSPQYCINFLVDLVHYKHIIRIMIRAKLIELGTKYCSDNLIPAIKLNAIVTYIYNYNNII